MYLRVSVMSPVPPKPPVSPCISDESPVLHHKPQHVPLEAAEQIPLYQPASSTGTTDQSTVAMIELCTLVYKYGVYSWHDCALYPSPQVWREPVAMTALCRLAHKYGVYCRHGFALYTALQVAYIPSP
jgi:hypothetical protein